MYGVDLHQPQHGHDEVKLKRFFFNFILEETGWSVSHLHRCLVCAGFDARGLSRRSLNYYVNTHEDALKDEKFEEHTTKSTNHFLIHLNQFFNYG